MQAEYKFNNYYSGNWTGCWTAIEEVNLLPNQTRKYEWLIDPKVFGLPDNDKVQTIVGLFFYADSLSSGYYELRDTLSIKAPKYYGGQLDVYFVDSLAHEVDQIKQELGAEILSSQDFILDLVREVWQITGTSVDSVMNLYSNDSRLYYMNYKRQSSYSSITTSVDEELLASKFYLSQNYPNPFNPNTVVSFSVPTDSKVKLEVFNILGQSVNVLLNEEKSAGTYEIAWNADNLPSGIYFVSIKAIGLFSKVNFTDVKKAVLLK